ncbi:thioesterase II family protein [Actinocorallia aurantiaca]|uniref:thioesterase II family protein n=1 Tax=Actinocorallia aurantiaca TaxID=46204 RepID=UPI0031D10198
MPRPRLRLVCFPHAGGGPHLFRTWPSHLPEDVEVLAVCYPGRQDRLSEPGIDRMEPLADLISRALSERADVPLALFGHSMGALVAYEVAVRLPGDAVSALLVSAHPAPHRMPPPSAEPPTDDELLHAMAGLGGTDPALLAHEGMRDLVLPALRADHELLRAYRPRNPAVVDIPVTGYLGEDDPLAGPPDLAAWADLTTGGFGTCVLPGGHFYLVPAERELVTDMSARLAQLPPRLARPRSDPRETSPCP